MRLFANIIWHFPFFGFVSATLVYLLGLLLTLTVVAAPIGLGLMELGKLLFAPFGKTMIKAGDLNIQQNKAWKAYSTIIMVLYLPFGILLAIMAILQIGMLFLTIIGIPVAIVVAKSLTTYLNPVGKKCVSSAVAAELERKKAEQFVAGLSSKQSGNTAQTVFCPECGKGNLAQARFCSGCGTSLPDRSQAAAATETAASSTPLKTSDLKKPAWQRIAAIAVGVLVIVIATVTLWPDSHTTPTSEPAQADEPAATVEKISPEQAPDSHSVQPVSETAAQPESTDKEEEVVSTPPQQAAPDPMPVEEPVQKPVTAKPAPKKAAPSARKNATTQSHASPQPVTAPLPTQASKPAPVQPVQPQATQPVIAHPAAEQPQKHQGLRGLIHEVTGIDPGTVSAVTEHECSASEKSMHANGC